MMYIKKFTVLVFCMYVFISKSQIKKVFEQLPINEVLSVNWKIFDYKQIKPFENILINYDLLILSESDHGDGASVDAQSMILKGLVDSGKINSIYIESSWINIDRISKILMDGGKDSIRATTKYMTDYRLKYWMDNGFWDYIANKIIEGKLKLFGFDIDGISGLIVNELFDEAIELPVVRKYIQKNPIEYEQEKFSYKNFDGWGLQSSYRYETYLKAKNFIDTIIEGYRLEENTFRIKEWQTILNFFYWLYKRHLVIQYNKYSNVIETKSQNSLFHSLRDSLMGEIFIDQYKKNGNEKAAALMASYHAMRNTYRIAGINDCCKDEKVYILSEILDKIIGNKMFSVCFVSASGERGINYYYEKKRNYKIQKPKKNSFEDYFKKADFAYFYTNLNSSMISGIGFWMKPVFDAYLKANWSKVFSGIFFVKHMYPINFNNYSVIN